MTNCGSGGDGGGTESCCTSLEVTGGTFYRTYDPLDGGTPTLAADGGPTGEADPATVSSFRLDKYLVTVGRFRQFFSAWNGGSGWTPPAGSGKHSHLNGGSGLNATGGGYEPGWVTSDNSNIAPTACESYASPYSTWTASPGANENLPINCVNWWEAYAFCIWDGGFLPSDAEWEYAAAGGSQQREYPWGTTAPGTASQYAIYDCYYPTGLQNCSSSLGTGSIAPVGTPTAGAGLWGQLDMAGDVNEFTVDWYATYVDPCTDCANLTAATGRVIRGGNFSNVLQPPPSRYNDSPSFRNFDQGLRCARSP
jgi:formylglycine-generating enzyme required for sulfatase activity